MSIKNSVKDFILREKSRLLFTAVGISIVVAGYLFGTVNAAGPLSYVVTLPAMIGIFITSLARVNDIAPQLTGFRWQVRRVALTMIGSVMVAYMYAPFSDYPTYPTWLASALLWGIFLKWITSPDYPKWHKYITGKVRFTKSGKAMTVE